jgi:hypothetical protein
VSAVIGLRPLIGHITLLTAHQPTGRISYVARARAGPPGQGDTSAQVDPRPRRTDPRCRRASAHPRGQSERWRIPLPNRPLETRARSEDQRVRPGSADAAVLVHGPGTRTLVSPRAFLIGPTRTRQPVNCLSPLRGSSRRLRVSTAQRLDQQLQISQQRRVLFHSALASSARFTDRSAGRHWGIA